MTCESSLVGIVETAGEDLFHDWIKRYRRSQFFLWSWTQKHSAGVLSFFSFSSDHRTCFAGSLVGRTASFLRDSLLPAPVPAFLPALSRFCVLSLSLFCLYFCSFFKLRLITVASTIDSMKRIITDDYHFPSCYVILRIVVIDASAFDQMTRSRFRELMFISRIYLISKKASKTRNTSSFSAL